MSVTQSMNSKANIKKFTNNDLPFSPAQPVMSSYYATSTAGQTVIDLSFSVDQTLTDQFFLFVDGKKLRLGSTNDYTFTSVGSDNRSAQVTLNQSLPINLNIQAYQLGLKTEAEFGTDARFTQSYEAAGEGFQGFVRTSTLITPTTTTGTPAVGTFHSTVIGRASMTDLSQDLGARMGINRIITQEPIDLINETGPNGERVQGIVNDTLNRMRFVGQGWGKIFDTNSQRMSTQSSGDYVEVTFYGTGLNLLTALGGSTYDYRVSVDGGAEGANILPATYVNAILFRNTSPNQVVALASGLAMGIHTVRVRLNTAAINLNVYGFEMVTSNTTNVTVNPGVGYIQNKKYTSASQALFAYNAEATGTRGGRVVVYQKGDGTIGRSWTPVNAASATYTLADHTNEEVIRSYHWREFSANRADDFSILNNISGSSSTQFVLDDGVTALATNSTSSIFAQSDAMYIVNSTATIRFTFVGTGLDLTMVTTTSNTSSSFTAVSIDGGANIGAITGINNGGGMTKKTQKIVSGLPYGTHTVTLTGNSGFNSPGIVNFIVYGPKKPSIPSGTIELADYNVVANFVANTTQGPLFLSTGVVRKSLATREVTPVGSGWVVVNDANAIAGNYLGGGAVGGNYFEYRFFGTGFDVRMPGPSTTGNYTMTINGVTPTAAGVTGSSFYGVFTSFTPGTGVITTNTAGTLSSGLVVTGLPIGNHIVRIAYNSGNNLAVEALDIITPIHVTANNVPFAAQATSALGSMSLSDTRKTIAVKAPDAQPRAIAIARGFVNSPTTTVTQDVPIPDLSLVIKTSGRPVEINLTMNIFANTSSADRFASIYVNGNLFVATADMVNLDAADRVAMVLSDVIYLPAGTHYINAMWRSGGGTIQTQNVQRTLTAKEL